MKYMDLRAAELYTELEDLEADPFLWDEIPDELLDWIIKTKYYLGAVRYE